MARRSYRQLGTEKSPGTKLFCLSGDVARPGLYEVPFGVTLRHLLFDLAGGVPGRIRPASRAVRRGGRRLCHPGPAGCALTFEDLRAAGLPLGSGVVMVFDETARPARCAAAAGALLCPRIVRQVLPLPARHAAPVRDPAARGRAARPCPAIRTAAGCRLDDERCLAVRAGPDCRQRRAQRHAALARAVRASQIKP